MSVEFVSSTLGILFPALNSPQLAVLLIGGYLFTLNLRKRYVKRVDYGEKEIDILAISLISSFFLGVALNSLITSLSVYNVLSVNPTSLSILLVVLIPLISIKYNRLRWEKLPSENLNLRIFDQKKTLPNSIIDITYLIAVFTLFLSIFTISNHFGLSNPSTYNITGSELAKNFGISTNIFNAMVTALIYFSGRFGLAMTPRILYKIDIKHS